MEEKLRMCLRAYYQGDAFGAMCNSYNGHTSADILTWTANGDIVAVITDTCARQVNETIPAILSKWARAGIDAIKKPPIGLSTVAQKIMDDPTWVTNPHVVAKKAVGNAPPHIVNINLPVSTAIALVLHDNAFIVNHAQTLSHDLLTAAVAVFYVEVLRILMFGKNQPIAPEEMINTIAPSLPVILPTDTLCSYTTMNLAELEIGVRPLYAMTTLKVICYALRVVYYARINNRSPDVPKVLSHIASVEFSDSSTNCAVALSVICAGCEHVSDFDKYWNIIENREWIDGVIDRYLACVSRGKGHAA